MRAISKLLLFGLSLVVFLLPSFATAQEAAANNPCAPPGYRTDVRPDPKGPPTVVTMGVRIADLREINDVDQTITIDLVFRIQWTDPRLAAWEGCKLAVQDIWFPEIVLRNSGRVFHRWPDTARVEKDGLVTYMQRAGGTFASYHTLADFPFDTQSIKLRLFPLEWSSRKLALQNDERFTGLSPLLNISDWQVTGLEAGISELLISALDEPRSGYDLTIHAQRYVSYYIWKIMLPIALIVVMSWCVFWIDPTQFGTQIGLSATSVLTMVAFIFATTNLLPRLGYFTLLDSYIAGATVFVFLALLESLSTGYLASQGKEVMANRIDLFSRFMFPLAFVVLCILFYTNVI